MKAIETKTKNKLSWYKFVDQNPVTEYAISVIQMYRNNFRGDFPEVATSKMLTRTENLM